MQFYPLCKCLEATKLIRTADAETQSLNIGTEFLFPRKYDPLSHTARYGIFTKIHIWRL